MFTETKPPNYYAVFVDVLYAVLVGETLFQFANEFLKPLETSTFSLSVVYIALFSSWLYWHKAVVKYPHQNIGRFILDMLVLIIYLLMFFNHSNITGVFWGFTSLYFLFFVWAIFRVIEHPVQVQTLKTSLFFFIIMLLLMVVRELTSLAEAPPILDYLFLGILIAFVLITQRQAINSIPETHDEQKTSKEIKTIDEKVEPVDISQTNNLRIQRLLSSISSRENSTLVVSTLAASVSMAILAVRLETLEAEWFSFAFAIGIVFPLLGFLYREITIYSIDAQEHRELNSLVPKSKLKKEVTVLGIVRKLMIRLLLLSPIIAWIDITYSEIFWAILVASVFIIITLSIFDEIYTKN